MAAAAAATTVGLKRALAFKATLAAPAGGASKKVRRYCARRARALRYLSPRARARARARA
jgi:hypothetical protein